MRDEEMLPFDTGEDIWSRLSSETRPLIIYGMGNGADKLLASFAAHGLVAADFVASDGFVRGQVFHGKRVLSFSEVREKYPQYVLVLAFGSSRAEVLDGIFSLASQG
ncbi:MAG: FkbM family methyltransferase, partial [Eubacteriales bacterium]